MFTAGLIMFSFGTKSRTHSDFSSTGIHERRQTKRKKLNGAVLLGVPDTGIICGDMVDIGTGGLSVIVATQLEVGQGCRVCFSIRLGTQKIPIDCVGIVVNSVCVAKGFRLGMRFIVTDIREQKVIERFLTENTSNTLMDSSAAVDTEQVHLDPPSVVQFAQEAYPKTVRISELGRR